jgi:NhaP-type Na+/H+ or K+/H+ antiporter
LVDLVGGVAVGVIAGYFGGRALSLARAAGWVTSGGQRIVVLMLAGVAFLVAEEVEVNYFVAAFVAGIAFRAGLGEDDKEVTALPELIGQVLALAVWFVFGAQLVLDGLDVVDWRIALYAVLSLTVIRMAPVALCMLGAGFGTRSTLFIGWFGPRGLASVVFGLLIVEELPVTDPGVRTVLSAITLTVLLSVIAHGVSARPLAAWLRRAEPAPDRGADEPPIRHRPHFGRRSV